MSRQVLRRSLLAAAAENLQAQQGRARLTDQEAAAILYPELRQSPMERRQPLEQLEQRSAEEILYPNLVQNNGRLYANNGQAANAQPAPNMNLPAGIRNNNPGNLEELPRDPWQGHIGTYNGEGRERGFSQFDTPESGLRALAVDIISKQVLRNRNTIREIIRVYAPETDNNPTGNYVDHVARRLGVDPDTQINTRDPATLRALMEGVITFENGNRYLDYYSTEQLDNATNAGMTHHRSRGR